MAGNEAGGREAAEGFALRGLVLAEGLALSAQR
jgi:hypothetical protein